MPCRCLIWRNFTAAPLRVFWLERPFGTPERAHNERPLRFFFIWIVSLRGFNNLETAPTGSDHRPLRRIKGGSNRLAGWMSVSCIASAAFVRYDPREARKLDELDTLAAVVIVMLKDSKKYASTGGWGFEAWADGDPKKALVTDPAKASSSATRRGRPTNTFSTYLD